MPIIRVWGLPAEEDQEKLLLLRRRIQEAVLSVQELGLKDYDYVTVQYPSDLVRLERSRLELIIEICGLFEKPERTYEVLNRLAANVAQVVRDNCTSAEIVECFVYPFNPNIQGFWSSKFLVI